MFSARWVRLDGGAPAWPPGQLATRAESRYLFWMDSDGGPVTNEDEILLAALRQRVGEVGGFERCDRLYTRKLAWLAPAFAVGFFGLFHFQGALWIVSVLTASFFAVQLGIIANSSKPHAR